MKRSTFLTSLLSLLRTPKGLLGKGETLSCPSHTKVPADPDAVLQSAELPHHGWFDDALETQRLLDLHRKLHLEQLKSMHELHTLKF